MLHLVSGISSLFLFVNLVLVDYQLFYFLLTYSCIHHVFLFWFTTLYIYNSISFTPDLKAISFTNHTPPHPLVLLLPPGLPPRTFAWTVSSA